MKNILFVLLLAGASCFGANPSFQDFNTNQFGVAGNKVVIKSGSIVTNAALLGTTTANSLVVTNNISGLNISSADNNGFLVGTRSRIRSSADGAMEIFNSTATLISTLRANQAHATKVANYVIAANASGLRYDNIGAPVTNRLDLPTAAADLWFTFHVDAAFRMQVQATGTDKIQVGNTLGSAAGAIYSSDPGSVIRLFSPKTGLWVVESLVGTWTLE